eukprot:gene14026-19963_t
MDALARVSYYFPTRALTAFWALANVIVNNEPECADTERKLLIALVVIFGVMVIVVSFTDTYTASDGQSYPVLIFPVYGPVCYTLPTIEDKDRVYDSYYLKVRDYIHAFISTTVFVLIALFISPISNCMFPSDDEDEGARFDSSTVRTVPIVVALIGSLMMMCLGPPRQMLGYTASGKMAESDLARVSRDTATYHDTQPQPQPTPLTPSLSQVSRDTGVYRDARSQSGARSTSYQGTRGVGSGRAVGRSRSMSPELVHGREVNREGRSTRASREPSPVGGNRRSIGPLWDPYGMQHWEMIAVSIASVNYVLDEPVHDHDHGRPLH